MALVGLRLCSSCCKAAWVSSSPRLSPPRFPKRSHRVVPVRVPVSLGGCGLSAGIHLRRRFGSPSQHHSRSGTLVTRSKLSVDNRELLTGDCLLLVAFCLYKQVTAIILHPTFPGWLAPLKFNLTRFEELASFAITLVASWIIANLLVGGYRSTATADLPTALTRVSLAWLVSMPVAACQLVLVTAAEDRALVGGELFASALPLAASGPGEPIATAAGVLGLMSVWRCFYALFLDILNASHLSDLSAKFNRHEDVQYFFDALKAVFLLSIAGIIIMQFLSRSLGEEGIQTLLISAGWQFH